MVAAGISGKGYDRQPRSEYGYGQIVVARNLFLQWVGLDILIDTGYDTHWQYLYKHPCRRVGIAVFVLEMQDEIFLGIVDFLVYQLHRAAELVGVGKQRAVGHPKDIAGLFRHDIGQSAAQGNFDLFDFIEHEKAEFLVEPIELDGRVKTTALFENLPVFGNFKERIEIRA